MPRKKKPQSTNYKPLTGDTAPINEKAVELARFLKGITKHSRRPAPISAEVFPDKTPLNSKIERVLRSLKDIL